MPPKLYLIRGLPGSGKSTRARALGADRHYEADMYFEQHGQYLFDPTRINLAHQWCQDQTCEALRGGFNTVVSNTFTKHWEMAPYLKMAQELGCDVEIIDLFDGGCSDEELFARNLHQVPLASIQRMRRRWEKQC